MPTNPNVRQTGEEDEDVIEIGDLFNGGHSPKKQENKVGNSPGIGRKSSKLKDNDSPNSSRKAGKD